MKSRLWRSIFDCVKITFGAAAFSFGFRVFLYPCGIMTGGITGLSMILSRFTGISVGVLTALLNIPIFLAGWQVLGRGFLFGSLLGTALLSLLTDAFGFIAPITREPFLACIYGGLLAGAGMGLVLLSGASTGGSDIIAILLRRYRPNMNIGQLILLFDALIISLYAVVFRNYDSALYSAIAIFISSKIIDGILYGFSRSKFAFIISERSDEIRAALLDKLQRGVTVLYGRGGYTGKDRNVLLCAIHRGQIVALKRIIRSIDSHSFIITVDSSEIIGSGFLNIEKN